MKKAPQIIKTGLLFLTFGIGSLTIAFTILPLIAISSRSPNKRKKRAQMAIHLSWRLFVFMMSSFSHAMSVKVNNIEILKNLKGHVIVANHPSLIDIVLLISYIPQANCVVKGALANNFFMRNIVKSLYIVNSLDFEEILRRCDESLKRGDNLIIFPEGTRTVPNQKSQISRGAAHIALHSHSNILPIRINCYPSGLLKNQKWYEVADKKMEYILNIKTPINIEEYSNQSNDRPIAARHLTDRIREGLEL